MEKSMARVKGLADDAAERDALRQYHAKRNFEQTPEPREGGVPGRDGLGFVVHKHWASSLHYDFRLELDGTLKSWAVPKGPSFDPKDKRMAVAVEDHPLSYASFEGTIPPKQYGAGKVIVWDEGRWAPLGEPHAGLREGNLKFELHGHKLRGRWVLVRMKGRGESRQPWLLIKEKDSFARPSKDFSVVDETPDSVKSAAPAAAATARLAADAGLPGSAAELPERLAPQLATLAEAAPADPAGWLYEIKFDGYRLLARIGAEGVRLFTRNGNDWTARLAPLQRALETMVLPFGWYDGEIVVPGDRGVPDFGALQQSFDAGKTGQVVYYLFDMPFCGGRDLRAVSLEQRRGWLKRLLADRADTHVRFSDEFDAAPGDVLASACRLGLEGVIAKRRSSNYQSRRSADWIKLKCGLRQEFVIGGYTEPQGSRTGLGSLLLGVHDAAGALHYAGNVGTGFTEKVLRALRARLDAIRRPATPFTSIDAIEGRPHWAEPRLVAEVAFGEWTRAGHIRHAVFHGLRADKSPASVVRETAARGDGRLTQRRAGDAASMAQLVRVTHPERVIDKSSGATKIDLVRYYALVGDLMMAHLRHRPVSLVRAPAGVGGELFFQKHARTETLPGIRQLDPALYISHPPLLEVASKDGLLSAAQWNVIELHTMNTGTRSLAHPDRLVFDLDPGAGVAWERVREAAELLHGFLGQLGLASFLKTSGGKGLHVVVPIKPVHDWDTAKGFSQGVVAHMAETIPQRFVARSGPKNRVGKIFIDYLRNGLGATTVCAWSARARPGLGISVPLRWSELATLRAADQWNILNAHARLDEGNDPWKGYAAAARSLTAARRMLGRSGP
jgi:bifunctional non-homologous end joining protein LigD